MPITTWKSLEFYAGLLGLALLGFAIGIEAGRWLCSVGY